MNYNYAMIPFFSLNKIHKLFLVFCLMLVGTSFGQISETTPGTYSFTVPAGVTSITVECWGAGGGGANGGGGGADGGGGGGYARSTIAVSPGGSYSYVVGSGGSAGTDGGKSTFSILPANTLLVVGIGGKTLGPGGAGNTGNITFVGGKGGSNPGSNVKGGAGGGSAAGSASNGIVGSDPSSDNGASGGTAVTGGGKGGDGGNKDYVGADGSVPGGGGGGGGKGSYGGKGGNGQVKITYCITYALTGTNTGTPTCKSDGTSTITLKGTPTSLPVGTYTVTYDTDISNQSGKTATMTVSTAGTGTFTATGLTIYSGASVTSTVKVTKLDSGACSNTIAFNNTAAVTVYEIPVGGGVYSGTTPICVNNSTGNMTLGGGYVGSVVNWEKRLLPSVTWTTITNTTTTYNESPSVGGTWEYRAIVGNGPCATTTSSAFTVVVNPASVGGTVSGGSTPICQGASIGTLTLSGYTGTILRWERQVNSGGWNYAGVGSATFTETAIAGICEYRAVVQSGNCSTSNSNVVTIVVNPTPVSGNVDYATTPICINTTTTLNLSSSTGTVVQWEKRVNSGSWIIISNTTTTLTEIPSGSGTWEYRALVGNGSCATVYSGVRQVVVNPEVTITLTNSNINICPVTTTASLAFSATTGSPSQWAIDFDSVANAAGLLDQSSNLSGTSGTIVFNAYNLPAGVYNGNLTVINYYPSCTSTIYPITLTVGVATPSIGTTTQPTCATSTGSVVLGGLPSSGTLYQKLGSVITSSSITGTAMIISGLAAGTYTFYVSNGSCTSSETASVVINPIETKTWNGSAWSGPYTGSAAPTLDQNIIFNGLYNSTTENVNGCSCEVKPGVTVNINSGLTLNLVNELTVALTATMTFFDTASLVQKNDVKNSGEIDYQRKTSTFRSTDYVYWSSPVSNQDISNLSAETINGIYYSYNSSVQDWNREYAGDMAAGVGYIVRSPDFISGLPVAPGPYTASFVGEPNNGTKTLAVSYTNNLGMLPSDPDFGASYLLGNPYPSALDAEKFLDYNAGVLGGTIYFWMHNTALDLAANIANPGPGWAYTYSLNDYAAYNAVGGVAVGSGDSALSGGNAPSGKIAAGQGFFATTIASGPVVFNNDMRVIGDNTQFFKTRKDKTDKVVEKNRIWLNLTNTQGVFKQTLIGYVANATNQYDIRYDGESYNGNAYVDFYSVNQDKNLTIQGRALPFSENDEVALGFTTTIDGPFTINIDHLDGALTNQNVYIEDKLTNTTFDLKSGNYTFNTEAGTFNDRFVLRYTATTLSTNDFNSAENKVLVSVKSKQITVNAFAETIKKVTVYDLLGRQIYAKDNVNSSSLLLSALNISHQTLVVKTTLENGKTITDKIIY